MSSLSPDISRIYEPLCTSYSLEQAEVLGSEVQAYAHKLQSTVHLNEFVDLAAIQHAETVLTTLLDSYGQLSDQQQSWLVGAARYFVEENDADHDVDSFLGIDDDIAVINYMLEQIGRIDLKIAL